MVGVVDLLEYFCSQLFTFVHSFRADRFRHINNVAWIPLEESEVGIKIRCPLSPLDSRMPFVIRRTQNRKEITLKAKT